MKTRLIRWIGPALSLGLFGAALWVLHRELAGYHLGDVLRDLQALPSGYFRLALLFTGLSYLVLTGYDWLAVRYVERDLAYPKVALASFIGYSFTYTVGHSLITGAPIRFRLYSSWGFSAVEVAKIVGFCALTFWVGFFSTAGIVFLIEPLQVPASLHLPFGSAHVLGGLFIVAIIAYLLAAALRREPLRLLGWEIPFPALPLAVSQVIVGIVDWVLAGAVLFLLLPEGSAVSFPVFLGMFLLAQIIGQASQVPGGLGVFEGALVLLLRSDTPPSAVLGSLVAYRLIYYFLPLAVAAVLLVGNEVVQRRAALKRLGEIVGGLVPGVIPQVLAATTFLGGIVLLASGATPAEAARLAWLKDVVPLPLVEFSHFLASLAGAGLLLLARGLQRRLDGAYLLTAALLVTGIIGSLLKGLDWEEAAVLAVFLAVLLPSRRHFYRRASLTGETFSTGWAVAVALVLLGFLWIGLFAYKHVEYTHELWWHFTLGGDAPRFLRASVGVVAVALLFGLARLLRAAPPRRLSSPAEDLPRVVPLVAAARESSTNLALLGDKHFLLSSSGQGFLMYGVEGRSWVSMGDPVGPPEDRLELAWRLRELCDQHDDWPVFYLVRSDALHLYLDIGLTLLKLGEEARVPLARFSIDGGGTRKWFRYNLRKLEKDGASFEIVPREGVSSLLGELREISDRWMTEKNTREKAFSLGFFSPDYLVHFPLAVIRMHGKIIAFANLWLAAEHEELSVDLMRFEPSAPHGVMDLLFTHLMLWGQAEGYTWFNLGMAPLSGLESRRLAPLWSRVGALAFRLGEHFYNFQGLRQYKEKWDPAWEPRYLASPGGLALPRVLANVAALINRGLKGVVAK